MRTGSPCSVRRRRRRWSGAATADSPGSLDRALAGSAAVINCAGPFEDTAAPVKDAALRAGIHYLDVTAETLVAIDSFADEARDAQARDLGVVIAPSMGFYGGLGDRRPAPPWATGTRPTT